jgi:hypothetical protein
LPELDGPWIRMMFPGEVVTVFFCIPLSISAQWIAAAYGRGEKRLGTKNGQNQPVFGAYFPNVFSLFGEKSFIFLGVAKSGLA